VAGVAAREGQGDPREGHPQGFPPKAEAAAPGDNDDLEAVRTALDFEAKGEKFYAQLRDASSDPKEKAFFELLSRMERQHYLSLKDTEDYFSDPEGWFRKKEHHGIDGA